MKLQEEISKVSFVSGPGFKPLTGSGANGNANGYQNEIKKDDGNSDGKDPRQWANLYAIRSNAKPPHRQACDFPEKLVR